MLRDYQEDITSRILHSYMTGHKRPCIVLPCGAGKSVIAANIALRSTKKGNQVLFLVHRKELCDQIKDTFIRHGVNLNLCHIGMVQTITRHLEDEPAPELIIQDEAHHGAADTYKRIYEAFPSAYIVGMTATPERLDGKGLGEIYDDLIEGVSVKWLIDNNYLAPYKYYSMPLSDFSHIKKVAGEYRMGDLMDKKIIYGDTVKMYEDKARGQKAIVYCPTIISADGTAMEFCAAGYPAASLSCQTPKKERNEKMEAFRRGDIKILCNVDLFGEGIDVPDCSVCVMLRKTASLTLYIQQAMRAMRYMPDKEAVIIDHVQNYADHGLPDDDRTWSLTGRNTKEKSTVKQCKACYQVVKMSARVCPYCGAEFAGEPREAKETIIVATGLEQITEKYRKARYNDYKRLKSYQDLLAFGQARGYAKGWAWHKKMEMGL
jgi:superfamily II DNA or RNA helicase